MSLAYPIFLWESWSFFQVYYLCVANLNRLIRQVAKGLGIRNGTAISFFDLFERLIASMCSYSKRLDDHEESHKNYIPESKQTVLSLPDLNIGDNIKVGKVHNHIYIQMIDIDEDCNTYYHTVKLTKRVLDTIHKFYSPDT